MADDVRGYFDTAAGTLNKYNADRVAEIKSKTGYDLGSSYGNRQGLGTFETLSQGDLIRDSQANFRNLGDYYKSQNIDADDLAAWYNSLGEQEKLEISQANDPWKAAADRFTKAGRGAKEAAAAKEKAAGQNIDNELLAMYQSYKQPIFDSGGQIVDPTAKMLAQGAAGLGATAAYGAAGEGGMNGRIAAQAASGALVPYQQFREQQASNAIGALSNRDLGLRTLAEQGRQFDAGASMQDQANQFNANKGLGSTIGGIAGGVAGGLATVFTGGAAAPLIPGLVSGGSAVGGTIAGAASGTPSSGASYRKYGGGY